MIRPFYISADIEGRKTPLAGGPARKDGGMTVEITQRNGEKIETAFTIKCYLETDETIVEGPPKLCTSIYDSNGDLVREHYTDYLK